MSTAVSRAADLRLASSLDLSLRVVLLLLASAIAIAYLAETYEWGRSYQVDVWSYSRAAERIAAGHRVYTFSPGDTPAYVAPPYWTAALSYPPLIAVLWLPMVGSIEGAMLWYAGGWTSLLATVAYVWLRGGLPGALLVTLLAPAIGQSLVHGNVNLYLVAGFALLWLGRDRGWPGLLLGVMAAIKIAPGLLGLWLLRQRDWRTAALAAFSLIASLALCIVVVGSDQVLEYVGVARALVPYPSSLSGITGVSWATSAALVVGAAFVLVVSRTAVSYSVAVLAMIVGSPAVHLSSLVILLAIGLPLTEPLTFAPRAPGGPRNGD